MLTGGRSRRMGTTKAVLEVHGRPMARRVGDALRAVGCDPVVAIGGDPGELAPLGMPVVTDLSPGEGPVGGLITALDAASARLRRDGAGADDHLVVVVSCDLPDLDADVLGPLVHAAVAGGRARVVVARAHRLEPLCAVWPVSSLAAVRHLFDGGERAMHRVIESLRPVIVDVAPDALVNVNTPEQLATVRVVDEPAPSSDRERGADGE